MKRHFLPSATTTTLLFFLLLSTTANGYNFVYDTSGDPLVAGGEYYIVPFDYNPKGGGFTWKENKKFLALCPEFNIIQITDGTNYGQPTSFYSVGTKKTKITLSTEVNIVFPEVSPPKGLPVLCSSSSNIWKVVGNEVELGGSKGDYKDSLFTIEAHDQGGYIINYCPNKYSKVGCGGLGIAIRDGQRRLVVNNAKPLAVGFSHETIVDNIDGKYAVV